MYILTKKENDIESGAYATHDTDGVTMIQFFVNKDDAHTYNEQLTAIGYELSVTETPDDNIDKICDILGFAYSIVEPGDFVIPRLETMTAATIESQ